MRLVKQTKSFARGELVEVDHAVAGSRRRRRARTSSPAAAVASGSTSRCAAQLAAKHAIVANALRRVISTIDPIVDAGTAARLAAARAVSRRGRQARPLSRASTNKLLPLARCPQLEPALEAVLELLVEIDAHTPIPEGELALLLGHRGEIAIGVERPWRAAPTLVGQRGIVGVIADDRDVRHAGDRGRARPDGRRRGTSRRRAPPATPR